MVKDGSLLSSDVAPPGKLDPLPVSIAPAQDMQDLGGALVGTDQTNRRERLTRLLALGGAGVALNGPSTSDELAARSQYFRGNI